LLEDKPIPLGRQFSPPVKFEIKVLELRGSSRYLDRLETILTGGIA